MRAGHFARQHLATTITETSQWGEDNYISLEKKATQLLQVAKDKVNHYKMELKENKQIPKRLQEFEENCDSTIAKLKLKLNLIHKKMDDFTLSLKSTVDEKTSTADLIFSLRNLDEATHTKLPSLPEFKQILDRPAIEMLNNQFLVEITNFTKDYFSRINTAETEFNRIEQTLNTVQSDLILSKYDILALAQFLEHISTDKLLASRKEIDAVLYAQSSWVFSMPEWEKLTSYINELFKLALRIDATQIKNMITEDLNARDKLEQEEKNSDTESSCSSVAIKASLDTARQHFSRKKTFLHSICQEIPNYIDERPRRKSDPHSKFYELFLTLKKEMDEAEEKVTSQVVTLREQKDNIRNKLVMECKELITKLESIHVGKIIADNKQRKRKEEKENTAEEQEAKRLVDEIHSQTKYLTQDRETKLSTTWQTSIFTRPAFLTQKTPAKRPLSAHTLTRSSIVFEKGLEKKFDSSSYKYYLGAATSCSAIGLAISLTGIIMMASNPAGWLAGLIIAGTALLAIAVPLFAKSYNNYQKNKALAALNDDNERNFAQTQNQILESKHRHSSSALLLLQRLGVKLTTPAKNGDILCALGKKQEKKLGRNHTPLFFNNKSGELYFKKDAPQGMKKILIREEKDIDQLARQTR